MANPSSVPFRPSAGARILRNSLFGMVARAVDMVMRMVIVVVIAHYLRLAGYGDFAFVMATTAFVLVLTDFGLEPILVRDLNAAGANRARIVGSLLVLRAIMGAAVLAGLVVIVALSDWSHTVCVAMLVAGASQALVAFQIVMLGVFRAHERMEYDAATSLVYQAVSFALMIVAVVLDAGLVGIVLAQLAGEAVKLALQTVWVWRRFLPLRPVWDGRQMRYFLREALPIIGLSLSTVVFFRINVFFLKAWRSPEDIAFFDSAQRLILSISAIPMMVVVAVFPLLCRMAGRDAPGLRVAYARSFKYLLIMGLGVTVGLAVWAKPIMMLYGSAFTAGAGSLRWLAASVAAGFLIPLANYAMTSLGRQSLSLVGIVAGVVANVLVDLWAVPAHGHLGAAAGFSVGTVVVLVVNGGLVRHLLGPVGLPSEAWRPLVAAALMAAAGLAVGGSGGIRMVAGMVLATVVYAAALFALRAVTAAELTVLRALRRTGSPGRGPDGPACPTED